MRTITCATLFVIMCLQAGFASGQSQPDTVRRVVTAVDATGKAVVIIDDAVPLAAPAPRNPSANAWATTRMPADLSRTDATKVLSGISPPSNGTAFRIVSFPPITAAAEKLPLDAMMKVVGDHAPKKGRPPIHPAMHRTRTIDYAIILSGEIDMMLDDTTVHVKAGDVVVQQATNHAWINRGKVPCRIAFILIDSEEP